MEIILATMNSNKVDEISSQVENSRHHFKSLKEVGWTDEIIEDGITIEENAWIKADTVWRALKKPVLSEDTGLIIDALNGEPGVHSARYAGNHRDDNNNIAKVLDKLGNTTERTARFQTTAAIIINGTTRKEFTGICEGRIALHPSGSNGFGYDPIFIPKGYEESFGTLDADIKLKVSHRSKAIYQVIDYLNQLNG